MDHQHYVLWRLGWYCLGQHSVAVCCWGGGMQLCFVGVVVQYIRYVAENPSVFDEAYWLINSIQVYQ